jgi:YD repeat-containing protein
MMRRFFLSFSHHKHGHKEYDTAKVEVQNAQGNLVAGHEQIYDPHGNLLFRKDHLYENGQYRNTQTVRYTYTLDHRIESLTRGFWTRDARVISYSYLPSGKLKTKTLPNGTILPYAYDPLGFLSRIDSSDGIIH